ncbi:hypothetical protein [Fontibacillus sp. BL9]|uniref:hypothetical protein n=1 Tax=Fontibacillus sp. BL9 TaxID=3389971 RepID=UPI003979E930
MKGIIFLTIRGKGFYFVDNGFTEEEVREMQHIADDVSVISKDKSEEGVCRLFVSDAQAYLGIELQQVTITHVIRIN